MASDGPRERDPSDYRVRAYESGDERAFIDLYNEIWSAEKTTDWFDWRYRDNPYVDEVPMFVATYDGDVVATAPFVTFRVRAGEKTRLAVLCTDVLTDAAHRRKGLFARTTERALAYYADRSPEERPAFLSNHANQFSRPGYEKMGWRYLSPQVRYNRLQRAGSYVTDLVGGRPGRIAGAVTTGLNRAYLDLRDRRTDFDTDSFDVERRAEVPAAEFAACYDACRPDPVHVVYDEAFYEWRFAEPGNPPDSAYLVRRAGRPVAGLITHRTEDPRNDTTAVTVSHVVPAAGGPERVVALAAAFEHLLAHYSRADLVRTANPLVPREILRAYGFAPDDRLPMSRLADPSGLTLGIRPLVDGEWDLNGRPIHGAEHSLWTLA
jgi:GNAT superfamily N-acetyltransferase